MNIHKVKWLRQPHGVDVKSQRSRTSAVPNTANDDVFLGASPQRAQAYQQHGSKRCHHCNSSQSPHISSNQFVSSCLPDRFSARPGHCTRYALPYLQRIAPAFALGEEAELTNFRSRSAVTHLRRPRAAATMASSTLVLAPLVLRVLTST